MQIFLAGTAGNLADGIIGSSHSAAKADIVMGSVMIITVIFILPIIEFIWRKKRTTSEAEYSIFIFNDFLRQSRNIIDRCDSGELIYRIQYDPVLFRTHVIEVITDSSTLIFSIILSLAIMLPIHRVFTVLSLILSLLPGIISYRIKILSQNIQQGEQKNLGKIYSEEKKLIDNFAFIKVHNLKNFVFKNLKMNYVNYYKDVYANKVLLERGLEAFNKFFVLACQITIYIAGSFLIAKGEILIGDAVKFFGISFVMNGEGMRILYVLKTYHELKIAAKRVGELISNKEESGKEKVEDIHSIEIKELNFGYGDKKILNNVTQRVNKGETLIIRGRNGSGKSTFAKLLTGLYSDYSGDILINNMELRQINKSSLRDRIAFAEQSPFLFNTTVLENIRIANRAIEDEELDTIVRNLGLYEIKDKIVGENGAYISGGEKQKISIGRAMIKSSSLVILDEPSNAIDSMSYSFAKEYFMKLGKTLIVITHDDDWEKGSDNKLGIAVTLYKKL